jgi:hypothetical protein
LKNLQALGVGVPLKTENEENPGETFKHLVAKAGGAASQALRGLGRNQRKSWKKKLPMLRSLKSFFFQKRTPFIVMTV